MTTKEEILDAIKGLSVLELADLVKALEDEFGVSAAAPGADGYRGRASPQLPRLPLKKRRPNSTCPSPRSDRRRFRSLRPSARSPLSD